VSASGLSRRDFVKCSATSLGFLSLAGNQAGVPANQGEAQVSPNERRTVRKGANKSFDPLLDPSCRRIPSPPGNTWQAQWIWYPGQLASHLQAKGLRAAMRRCTSVGYPGSFRQPLSHVYLQTHAVVEQNQTLRWTGPLGRIRLIINGREIDITTRSDTVEPGLVDLLASIDFADSLPCLLLEGGPLSTNLQWQASLDRRQWVAVESEPMLHDPNVLPDGDRELVVEIFPDKTVKASKVVVKQSSYRFAPGGELILDFRHDELGKIAFEAQGSGKLSFIVGESLPEVNSSDPEYFEQWGLPDVELASQMKPVLLPERCVRFVRISSNDVCQLQKVCFLARVSPVEYKGHFECSDPQLNDIWAAGAATLHACMHDFYLDGIRRDALSWHDGLIGLEAGDLVFADACTARQTIISQSLPPRPTVQDLGIADAPLCALTAFENDYLVRGDLEFSRCYQDRIHETFQFFMSLQDVHGFVNGRDAQPYGFFPDWSATAASGPDPHGTPSYAQMLLMRAFEIGAAFANRWGDPPKAALYGGIANNLRQNIRQFFWSAEKSAYINGFDPHGVFDSRLTPFAQTNAILFDLATPQEWGAMFKGVLDDPSRYARNWSISQQWEFLAYAKAGRIEALEERLKSIWGKILKQGYTRFWEDIRPQDSALEQLALYRKPFANSLCHGWAGAAPILALVRGILGIWSREAGYAECDVRPRLGDLEWVRGTVPAPVGSIELELERKKGGQITLPAKVSVKLTGYTDEAGKSVLKGPGTFSLKSALAVGS
jgi:hypothetical protein